MLGNRIREPFYLRPLPVGRHHGKVRGYAVSSINNRRNCRGKLYGRDLERLTEGDCCKLHRLHVLHFVHNGSRFPGQIHTGFIFKAKPGKILIILLYSQPQPHRNKHRITAIHGGLNKILSAVPHGFVAADPSVLYHNKSRAAKPVFRGHHTFLQSGGGSDDLKGRTRFIGIVDTAVPPHLIQFFLLLFFRKAFRIRSLREGVGVIQVKFRHVHHGHNFPVLRIHHQDRHPLRLLGLHHLLCKLGGVALDIHIQADIEVISRYGLYSLLACGINLHSPRIRHGQDHSLLPLQIFLVFDLQADNSLIVSSGKAKYLGGKAVIGIVTFVILIHLHPFQIVGPDCISLFFSHIAFDPLNGGILFYPLTDIIFRKLQFPA